MRKNSPQLISDVYAKRDKEILRCLEDVKISLCTNSEFNDCNIELNNPFDNLNMKQVRHYDFFEVFERKIDRLD